MRLFNNIAEKIIDGWMATLVAQQPPVVVFKNITRQQRSWGARDRKLFGKGLYDGIRWYRKYLHACELEMATDRQAFKKMLICWSLIENIKLPEDIAPDEMEQKKLLKNIELNNHFRAIKASIPDWLDKLGTTYYKTEWDKECEAFNETAPLIIRANTLKTTTEALKKRLLEEAQIQTQVVADIPAALLVESSKNLTTLEAYKRGLFEIQDANSQQIGHFVDPQKNQLLIDVCAGAGGKSLHLAALMQNTGQIIALDKYAAKLERLHARAQRNGVKNLKIETNNDAVFYKNHTQKADIVLIDAPCSGLGVLRRHPEHKWVMNPQRIEDIRHIQQDILVQNAELVKPHGTLFYATCSIFPNENQEQIAAFLKTPIGLQFALDQEKTFLTHQTGHDGFYISKLTRNRF